jgi:predicted pyridoxine 5'-phosphate oxidase superfamily flavin-nucleotide-binding protein
MKCLIRHPGQKLVKKLIKIMITEEILSGLQGALPSAFATVDEQGIPNVSYISQVYYVDENHVALSNQFFNKSMRNIKSNSIGTVNVIKPDSLKSWYIKLKYKETRTSGELFDNMSMQLEAIASMVGMEDVFKLQAAEVFEVTKIDEVLIN